MDKNLIANQSNVTILPEAPNRMRSIDQIRGLLIFLNAVTYICGAFVAITSKLPFVNGDKFTFELLKGIPLDDIFLPMFVFIMGLTACSSFKKLQEAKGQTFAAKKFAFKYLVLIGFGTVMMDGLACAYEFIAGKILSEFKLGEQAAIILFFACLPLILFYFITKIIRNKKLTKIAGLMIKIVWAFGGAAAVFFLATSTGAIFSGVPQQNIWDVFQTIGLAGLIALPFMGLNRYGKLIAALALGVLLTAFYRYGGLQGFGDNIFNGGLVGGFGWAIAVLLGGYFRDVKQKPVLYWVSAIVAVAVPAVLVTVFGFVAVRRGCTPVYAVFASGLGAVIWGIFNLIERVYKPKYSFLSIWGGSSLLTYALSMVFATLLQTFVPIETPLFAAIIVSVVIVGGLYALNHILTRKDIHIKI
ncbi:MAG: hypothetical protein LBT30_04315 [Clostridiales bacterium]|jgi:hypothetical protein|nr:hypothetical protein [Clostridiales bacterium]